jgi:hypothetical protein
MSGQRTSAVLRHLLGLYPAPLTIDEVVRELTGASEDFDECAAIESGVRELLAAGLLQRHGDFLLPTRAAVHFGDAAKA